MRKELEPIFLNALEENQEKSKKEINQRIMRIYEVIESLKEYTQRLSNFFRPRMISGYSLIKQE